jgi:hypothetical protein
MVTLENEALQVLDRDSAGEFRLSLIFDGNWLLAMCHHKGDDSTGELTETEYYPCNSVNGERFPGRFVLKKNSLMTDILRSIVLLEKIGVMGYFGEVTIFVLSKLHWGKHGYRMQSS